MTMELWEPGTKQATPRPLPGPSTAIGAPNTASPPPTGYKSAAVRSGSDKAVASKSIQDMDFSEAKCRTQLRGINCPRGIGEHTTIVVNRPGNREQRLTH